MMSNMLILMKQELALCLLIFLLLILKLAKDMKNETVLSLTQFLFLFFFIIGFIGNETGELFGGMYRQSSDSIVQKNILSLGFYLMPVLFASWMRQHEHLLEFLVLMACVTLGMFLMISSAHMLMFYLSLELSSIPLAAMVNFDLRLRKSSEAAMKMILSSAFSSGILLMGISFIYGSTGTLLFDEIAASGRQSGLDIAAFMLFFSAFAFKLSVVPFHFWTADVYEGAPVPVAAFLSVMSKAAMAFVLMNICFAVFPHLFDWWHEVFLFLSALTILTGNLFALRQENIKRFLAFSSISQVGFILLAIAANMPSAKGSVHYFLLIYLLSNLAAFSVICLACVHYRKECISDFRGFYKENPFLSWVILLALFSLAGIPPLAGFFGKFFLLSAGAGRGDYFFVVFAALNMVVSLYYYVRLARLIFSTEEQPVLSKVYVDPMGKAGLTIIAVAMLLLGLTSWVYDYLNV